MSFVALPSCLLVFSVASTFPDQSQTTIKPGEDVTLQCHSHSQATIRLLEWIRPDLKSDGYVFFYRNGRSYEKYQHSSYHRRVEQKDPEMKDGDVSVILKNVNINDTGTYECQITTSNLEPLITIITLTVERGHTEEGGDEERGDKGGGDKRGHVGLTVSLSIVVLFLCFLGFLMARRKKKSLNQPPSDEG